jgi:hypothetical protein
MRGLLVSYGEANRILTTEGHHDYDRAVNGD